MEQVIDTGAAQGDAVADPGARRAGPGAPDSAAGTSDDAVTASAWRPGPADRSAAGREAHMAYDRWRRGGGQAAYVAYLAAADRTDSVRAALAAPDADAA